MSAPDARPAPFAARPRDPETWVGEPERSVTPTSGKSEIYSARLTVDVTSALRGRIKVAAFTRGLTVADMLRAMLEQAFPDQGGDAR